MSIESIPDQLRLIKSLMTTYQVAELCQVSHDTVRKWLKNGDLQGIDVSTWKSKRYAAWRIDPAVLAAFLERKPPRRTGPTPRRQRTAQCIEDLR